MFRFNVVNPWFLIDSEYIYSLVLGIFASVDLLPHLETCSLSTDPSTIIISFSYPINIAALSTVATLVSLLIC